VVAHSEPKTSNVVAPVAPRRTVPSFRRVMQGVLFGVLGAANCPYRVHCRSGSVLYSTVEYGDALHCTHIREVFSSELQKSFALA
jgi:hypothetical protein